MEELRRQFEQLWHDGLSVTQYEMRFSELARHAVWLVPIDRERIRRFIDGLTYQLWLVMTRERVSGATFDKVVDIARQIEVVHSQERGEREAKRPRGPGDFCGVPSGGQFYRGRGRPYRHAQTGRPVHRGASSSHGSYSSHQGQPFLGSLPAQSSSRASSDQGSFAPGASSSYSGSRGPIQSAPPPVPGSCFECGEFGHMWRQCPRRSGGLVQYRSQTTTSAPVTSPPAQPAWGRGQVARGRLRGGGRSGGGQARFYAFPAKPDIIASDAVITGIVSVCHSEASILFDPGSTYSYVSSYFTHHLDIPREPLVSPICVSTRVGDTIIVDHVYQSCVVTIGGLENRVDLLLLNMVDFDVILCMDWLSPCHAILDCHTKTMALTMPGLPKVEWRGSLDYAPSKVQGLILCIVTRRVLVSAQY
ncbi:uncharacterized protein [Nicotiana tomentosiformis]|uniref:uncharacterized protein n=1 Tax=Nicotiana tomentosiformis TaxID=4098 RepID=UPI00388C7139